MQYTTYVSPFDSMYETKFIASTPYITQKHTIGSLGVC